ncbi:hypothetical protein BGX38DRAFT_1276310 [Terfezia claveryi]|nr:hypothetical protein BGX38DRAFT_1276310 [Terfezia claveryi]
MTTNGYPYGDILFAELVEFLNVHHLLNYDPRTQRWILMSIIIREETLETLIKLIVMDWMQNGITKIGEFETQGGMNLDQVVAMVQEKGEGLNWNI